MRIAIITIQSNNYGNRLQNYALQSVLAGLGHEVYSVSERKPLVTQAKQLVRQFVKHDSISAMRQFNKRLIDYAKPVDKSTASIAELGGADKFIIGSDQVWNPTFSFNSDFEYLPFVPAERKLAYAASFGVSNIVDNKAHIAQMLEDIPRISMREGAGAEILKELTGRDVPVVLDPTLLLTSDRWKTIAKMPYGMSLERPYLLKYLLGDNIYDKQIEDIASGRGLEIVDLLNLRSPIGPAEFICLFSCAALVCTDSFHGSVFSVLYHRPFVIFERQSDLEDMSCRFDTLCSSLGLFAHRYASDAFDLKTIESEDWDLVEDRLVALREKSIRWLIESIGRAA